METRPHSTDAVSKTTTTAATADTASNNNNVASNNNINNDDADNNNGNKKKAVRHAEKRRTATCRFSNRVAAVSVQHYRQHVSVGFQQTQKQTCLATIVAHERLKPAACVEDGTALPAVDRLTVVGMGVGTKFLSESILQEHPQQRTNDKEQKEAEKEESYGSRVRDCHAEVLARRAFRCHLSLEMKRLLVQQHVQQQQQGQEPPDPVDSILECCLGTTTTSAHRLAFRLRSGVTLHLYTSSAPCGNACLKKFATMSNQAEVFREDLNSDEWPLVDESDRTHEYTPGHSIPLGQFALLVKKDSSVASISSYEDYEQQHTQSSSNNNNNDKKRARVDGGSEENVAIAASTNVSITASTPSAAATTVVASGPTVTATAISDRSTGTCNATFNQTKTKRPGNKSKSPAYWPANVSETWCPPGTTTVWSGRGSLHTCSDKICRWNCLGLQGSLLAALLVDDPVDQQNNQPQTLPLYLSTVTVGRKLTPVVCRRAICCRVGPTDHDTAKSNGGSSSIMPGPSMRCHHPTIMGTSVYMDDTGVIDMSKSSDNKLQQTGQDVRFHSTLSWAWWPALSVDGQEAECIDGATGWAILPRQIESEHNDDEKIDTNVYDDSNRATRSRVSTASLLELYIQIDQAIRQWTLAAGSNNGASAMEVEVETKMVPRTLTELRSLKKQVSRPYEDAKERLLTKHPVLRQWKRRENHSAG